jgi:glycosyltransferase involved in cell wall biosynthesis
MTGLLAPKVLFELWQIARLRSKRASTERRQSRYRTFTRARFAAARNAGDQTIYVIIPCFNEARHLPSALVALARSDNALPIVVDNHCTDNTADIAEDMGAVVISQPTGKKMAATQRGIDYVLNQRGCRRMLFLDGDTMPLPNWATSMDRMLRYLDTGEGAAVFGTSIKMFGLSHLANTAATTASLFFTYLRHARHETPIANGHNYGLSFDNDGVMAKKINKLDKNVFAGSGNDVPDDAQILLCVQTTPAVVRSAHASNTWVVTNNDHLASLRDIFDLFRSKTSYAHLADKYYAQEYGNPRDDA